LDTIDFLYGKRQNVTIWNHLILFCGADMGVLEGGPIAALTQDGWFAQENFLPASVC
jgi:hypothetical protein